MLYIVILVSLLSVYPIAGMSKNANIVNQKILDTITGKKATGDKNSPRIPFQFDNEDLTSVINTIAAAKDVNIILPQGGKAISNAKITFKLDQDIPVEHAWQLLHTLLDVAGYSIKSQGSMYAIIQNSADIYREPMPTFIGTPIDDLPASDQWIRCVTYLANLQVNDDPNNELLQILRTLLPVGSTFKIDVATNGLIIVSKSRDIKAAMEIINQLDTAGFQEKMEIISLQYSEARMVADLFKQQILPEEAQQFNKFRLDTRKPTDAYFSPHTRIIAEERRNALIIVGRSQAVDRLKEFITSYIDIPSDSGKSILHIYQLQYLSASQVAEVLTRVIESTREGGTEQSRSADGKQIVGPQRYFDEVIIKADKPEGADEAGFAGYFGYQQKGENGKSIEYNYSGGNKLVVAARNDDWKRIKRLIEDIDKPQRQVLIEVLIGDITVDDERQLGSQTRLPDGLSLPSHINIQSAHLAGPVVDPALNPTTIKADLLGLVDASDGTGFGNETTPTSLASIAPVDAAQISLNDNNGKTWSLLQVLQSFGHSKILSNPHVVTGNNKEALIKVGERRLVTGKGSYGPTVGNVQNDEINANLQVRIKPRVSSADDIVNLTVNIDIQQFRGPANVRNDKINRTVQTNANVKNKGILALGGLIQSETEIGLKSTPLLEKIPIFGWLAKNRTGSDIKRNLTVFIKPTIIEPRLRRGISSYTKDYITLAKTYTQEGALFESLRDPITRWLFNNQTEATEIIDQFVEKDEFQTDHTQKSSRERKKERIQERATLRSKERARKALKDVINDDITDISPLVAVAHRKKKDLVQ